MPCSAVVLVLQRDRNNGEGHGMRKARVFGQVLGVQGMVIEDVTVQTDPDGDEEILVVWVRPDALGGALRDEARPPLEHVWSPSFSDQW